MSENININLSPRTEKSSHLKAGINPIFACIGVDGDFTQDEINNINRDYIFNSRSSGEVANINYEANPYEPDIKDFFHNGRHSYFISTIDEKNKFSNGFLRCIGLVVVGKDKKTGKDISFLTHQDPESFLKAGKSLFINHLQKRLEELKAKCEQGTIDAIIIGGDIVTTQEYPIRSEKYIKQRYYDSIQLTSKGVESVLGFEPTVINGPKTETEINHGDNFYFENNSRQIYFIRPKVNKVTRDFLPSEYKN